MVQEVGAGHALFRTDELIPGHSPATRELRKPPRQVLSKKPKKAISYHIVTSNKHFHVHRDLTIFNAKA
jgi:hypothetical protein